MRQLVLILVFCLIHPFPLSLHASSDKLHSETTPVAESAGNAADSTLETKVVTADEFTHLPVRSLWDIIGLQGGAVETRPHYRGMARNVYMCGDRPAREAVNSQEINVRGSRPYESGYYLNGVSVSNLVIGYPTISISPRALRDLTLEGTGVPIYLGSQGSGVHMHTLSGGQHYSGMVEVVSDNAGGSGFDQNWYTARLSGPLPLMNRGSWSGLLERRWHGDRNPSSYDYTAMPHQSKALEGN